VASNKRGKELARMRAERQAARRAAAAARRRQRTAVVASVVAVAVVAVAAILLATKVGGSTKTIAAAAAASPSASTAASASPAASLAPGTCAYPVGTPASRKVALPPKAGVEQTQPYTVSLKTTQGVIALKLDTAKAPCTVNSFRSLAMKKFFDGTPCHRLTTQGIYVLQCGDPSGKGTGGPGYSFADENLKGATYPAGTVAMANSGPDTNGSQFFLVYKDTQLAPSYTPFGTITSGLDILAKVAAAGSTPADDGKPKLPVSIQTAIVAAAPQG
jgi:peptidyl-prolyl cis-trans isomerase B (cyclophilin B)